MKCRGYAVLADKAYSEHGLRNDLKRKGITTAPDCLKIQRASNIRIANVISIAVCSDTYDAAAL